MKCKIVLLESPTGTLMLEKDITWNIPGTFRGTKFHLYFVSDDEIQVGDYYTIYDSKAIHKASGMNQNWYNEMCKKVVATTDQSLNLLEIPDQFINYYLDNNGDVDEVEVNKYESTIFSSSSKLFTREEVVELLEKLHYQAMLEYPMNFTIDNWIKENL